MRVAIIALGPSAHQYARSVESAADRSKLFDETWVINGFGGAFHADRIFAMDDVKVQEARGRAGNGKIDNLAGWLKKCSVPVYTSRAYPDYPALIPFPLEHVVNTYRCTPYFNNTVAYALAFAGACPIPELGIDERVTELTLYGADFTYANQPAVEKGRGCCEWWLGVLHGRGLACEDMRTEINITQSSSLMSACERDAHSHLYGYDTQQVICRRGKDDRLIIEFKDRPAPTAQEIEQRYYKGVDPKLIAA